MKSPHSSSMSATRQKQAPSSPPQGHGLRKTVMELRAQRHFHKGSALKLVSLILAALFIVNTDAPCGELPEVLELNNGKKYEGVKLLSSNREGIKIQHKSGIVRLPFEVLPEEIARQYKVDIPQIVYSKDLPGDNLDFSVMSAGTMAFSLLKEKQKSKVENDKNPLSVLATFGGHPDYSAFMRDAENIRLQGGKVFAVAAPAEVVRLSRGSISVKPKNKFNVKKYVDFRAVENHWKTSSEVMQNGYGQKVTVNRVQSVKVDFTLSNSRYFYENFIKESQEFVIKDYLRKIEDDNFDQIFFCYLITDIKDIKVTEDYSSPTLSSPIALMETEITAVAKLSGLAVIYNSEPKDTTAYWASERANYLNRGDPMEMANIKGLKKMASIDLSEKK